MSRIQSNERKIPKNLQLLWLLLLYPIYKAISYYIEGDYSLFSIFLVLSIVLVVILIVMTVFFKNKK